MDVNDLEVGEQIIAESSFPSSKSSICHLISFLREQKR